MQIGEQMRSENETLRLAILGLLHIMEVRGVVPKKYTLDTLADLGLVHIKSREGSILPFRPKLVPKEGPDEK